MTEGVIAGQQEQGREDPEGLSLIQPPPTYSAALLGPNLLLGVSCSQDDILHSQDLLAVLVLC